MIARQIALDLDGTLITCEQKHIAVLRYAAAGLARVDLQQAWNSKRQGYNTVNALRLLDVSEQAAKVIAKRWEASIEDPCWLALDTAFLHVKETLRGLRERGLQLSLITARKRPHWLKQQLLWLGLWNEFSRVEVVNPGNSINEKSTILTLINPLVFIGDTEADGEAARQAGIPFQAVSTGQRTREYLETKGFGNCFDSLSEALKSGLA